VKVGEFLSKLGPFKWSLHNIVAHPLSEIVYLIGFERASNWIHDITAPDKMGDKEQQGVTDQKKWVVKIEYLDEADRYNDDLCVKLPDELMKQLGWEIGDEVEWGETEICEDWGEHKGFILSNLTKLAGENKDEGS